MQKKKILVIDDSALMRRVESDIINSDERLHVEDTASNGLDGLDYLKSEKHYDLVMVDINMPKLDGIGFLEQAEKLNLDTKFLVVSSIAGKDASETIRALELGAFDFVRKPTGMVGSRNSDFKDVLLTKVYYAVNLGAVAEKQTIDWKEIRQLARKQNSESQKRSKPHAISGHGGKLVLIASSTGGPKSLQKVIPKFPADFPYPVVVVQHMPEGFTDSLAKRLDEMSELHVKEVEDGEALLKGNVYIAKGGHHCKLHSLGGSRYKFELNKEPARNGLRPCADVFIETLSETEFDHIVCAVLTGMGDDATHGLLYLQQYKNISVVAQDEQTCVVYGMPRAVRATGIVDEIVALDEVTSAIIKKAGE